MSRSTTCPACGAAIVWLPTETGGFIPVNSDHPALAHYRRWNPHTMEAHYRSCSHARDRYHESVARGRRRVAAQRLRMKEEVA